MKLKLTEKQKRFADYYIETGNSAEAARKAGYSIKTARAIGSENLTKPHIKDYIEKRLKELEDQRVADVKEVLEYLTTVMRGDVDEEVVIVENLGDYTSGARVIKKQVGVKERNKAAELLGKKYTLFTDKTIFDGDVGVKIIDDVETDDEDEND